MINLWADGWVPGENRGQQVGFGLPRGHYAVDQVTFATAQGHYPVNLNHVLFVGAQDHYQYFDNLYRSELSYLAYITLVFLTSSPI